MKNLSLYLLTLAVLFPLVNRTAHQDASQAAAELAQAGTKYCIRETNRLTSDEVHAQLTLSFPVNIPPFILYPQIESFKQQPNTYVVRATNHLHALVGYLTAQIFTITEDVPPLSLPSATTFCLIKEMVVVKQARRQKIATSMLKLLTQHIAPCPVFATASTAFPLEFLQATLQTHLSQEGLSLDDIPAAVASLSHPGLEASLSKNSQLSEEMLAQIVSIASFTKDIAKLANDPDALSELSQGPAATAPFLESQGFERITDEQHPDGNKTAAARYLHSLENIPAHPGINEVPEYFPLFAYRRLPQQPQK